MSIQEIASMERYIFNQKLAQAVRALQKQIQQLQEQIQQLQKQLQRQINENIQLQEQIKYLKYQTHLNESNTRQIIEANQNSAQQTKIAKPDLFYRERKKLQIFISQLKLYFFFNMLDFLDEDKKIMFAAIYL